MKAEDDLSACRAIRVALGLAPRPDMTLAGRLRRALRRAESQVGKRAA